MVYEYKDSTWTQIGQDVIGTGSANFGLSCRLNSSGNRFIAGGAVADDTKGYVEIYELIDSTWTLMGQRINGVQGGAMFGSVVDIDDDGNRVCVSSVSYDHSGKERVGRTQVYDWNGSAWIEVYDIIGETARVTPFGNRCSLSGDGNRLVVASDDSNPKGKLTIHQLPKKIIIEIKNNEKKIQQLENANRK